MTPPRGWPRSARPLLVVAAGRDRLVSPHLSRVLANGIPNAKLVEIENAPHGINLERADEVNAIIGSWLRGPWLTMRRTSEIAKTLHDLADAMEMTGAVAFRVKAVRGGARIIETLNDPAIERLQAKTLTEVKGIGEEHCAADRRAGHHGQDRRAGGSPRSGCRPSCSRSPRSKRDRGPKTAQLIHEKAGRRLHWTKLEAAGRR